MTRANESRVAASRADDRRSLAQRAGDALLVTGICACIVVLAIVVGVVDGGRWVAARVRGAR